MGDRRAGPGLWFVGDTLLLLDAESDAPTAELVGASHDGPWLAAAICFAVAVALMYARARPERDWRGALDAAALALSLAVLAWAILLDPLAGDRTHLVSALWVIYPALAIAAAATAGWLLLRLGGQPPFLRAIALALALLAGGEIIGLAAALEGTHGVWSWVLYAGSAWVWAVAAARRIAHPRLPLPRAIGDPPTWSHMLPAIATLLAVGTLAWDRGVLGALVFVATAVASVRLIVAQRASTLLLAERRQEATTDPLTGIANRRQLGEDLRLLNQIARRGGAPLSALAIDLDGFKRVNDTHGHQRGDEVLVTIAGALGDHLRHDDRLYRVGGDEFVALLPATAAPAAAAVAERLRQRVAALATVEGVTLSVGVAEGPVDPRAPEPLLRDADTALYRAKTAGRNRVMLAASAPTPGG